MSGASTRRSCASSLPPPRFPSALRPHGRVTRETAAGASRCHSLSRAWLRFAQILRRLCFDPPVLYTAVAALALQLCRVTLDLLALFPCCRRALRTADRYRLCASFCLRAAAAIGLQLRVLRIRRAAALDALRSLWLQLRDIYCISSLHQFMHLRGMPSRRE